MNETSAQLITWRNVLFAFLFAIVLKKCLDLFGWGSRFPPGPWGVPVLGYLPWLSKKAYLDLMSLGKQYGSVFSLRMGSELVVVLNDWPAIKASLVDQAQAFSGRPFNVLSHVFGQNTDVAFTDGLVWKKQRKTTITCLKKVGVDKTSLEPLLHFTIHNVIDEIKAKEGQLVDLNIALINPASEANWRILSSHKIADNEEDMEIIKRSFEIYAEGVRMENPVGPLPWLRFIPPNGFGFWKYRDGVNVLRDYIKKVIEKHHKQLDNGNNVIDYYIEEMKAHGRNEPPYTDEHLLGTIVDLVVASADTTASTLLFAFLYLATFPDIQRKVQEELDSVVGSERLLGVDEVKNLPYLDAFVMETMRYSSIIPLSVPHKTMKEVEVLGYKIPKGVTCMQNIYAVHHDPKYWDRPEEFKPERFIDENNRTKAPPYLMPFSIGPRVCLGQSIAEVELRMIIGGLLQKFSFSLPDDRPKPNILEPVLAILLRPQPYLLKASARK